MTAGTIHYALPVMSRVHIALYDMRGRKLFDLVNGRREAGFYAMRIGARGRSLASGSYLCRMKAGSFRATARRTELR
jgi:hypothetical protein